MSQKCIETGKSTHGRSGNAVISYAFCFILIILFLSGSIRADEFTSIINIQAYGAVGDGRSLNTKAIQKAIDHCAANGGKVYIPSGDYLTGSLQLRSNVTIEISEGAILLGSVNIEDYEEHIPKIRSYNDSFLKHSLFYAEDEQNITITGRGLIDGQGAAFIVKTKKKPDRYMNRPYVIRFVNCKNVLVENIRMQNSASWMQHYLACDQVKIRGISVYNHCNNNNDMIDIDGSSNVFISDCIGDTDDDALTIKSTSDRISKNITVTNCIFSSHCNAIKLGTESHGGFENIMISNCIVKPSKHPTNIYGYKTGISGITLGLVDGGVLDGVMISNIRIDGPKVPIYLRLGDRGRIYKQGMERPDVGTFKNVMISHIYASGADTIGCSITGLPDHPVENVTLDNITILFKGGSENDVKASSVKEEREQYPESTMFGKLPAYGFFLRHIKGLNFYNVSIKFEQDDHRPVIVADDVENVNFANFNADVSYQAPEMIYLSHSSNVWIKGSGPAKKVKTFLYVEGDKTRNISLTANNLRKADEIFRTGSGVLTDEIHIQ